MKIIQNKREHILNKQQQRFLKKNLLLITQEVTILGTIHIIMTGELFLGKAEQTDGQNNTSSSNCVFVGVPWKGVVKRSKTAICFSNFAIAVSSKPLEICLLLAEISAANCRKCRTAAKRNRNQVKRKQTLLGMHDCREERLYCSYEQFAARGRSSWVIYERWRQLI